MDKQKSESFRGSAMLLINQTSLFFELVGSMIIEGEMKKKEKNMAEIRKNVGF